MIRILFICHGNICRSSMAEAVMRDMIENIRTFLIRGIRGILRHAIKILKKAAKD